MKKLIFTCIQLLSGNKIIWKKKKGIYLTFDDGPRPEKTLALLEILSKHGALATFFVCGENARKYPEIIEEIYQHGHTVANHTYSHDRFNGDIKRFSDDVNACEKYIAIKQTKHLLRPPFGTVNLKLLSYIIRSPYTGVYWSKDTKDYMLESADDVLNYADIDNLEEGDIVLLHDFPDVTPTIVERILNSNKDKRFFAL